MKIKPLINYNSPKYPELKIFVNKPDNLLKNIPAKWKVNKVVCAALISFALGSQSCNSSDSKSAVKTEITANDKQNLSRQKNQTSDTATIAPLFSHGEGIGSFGCIVVAPPVFINESDARQIIINELKKENLNFDNQYNENIPIERKLTRYISSFKEYKKEDKIETNNLTFDGYNKELNFAFEFVSSEDYNTCADMIEVISTASTINCKNAAENIRKNLITLNKVNAVVFYEPLPNAADLSDNYERYAFEKNNYKEALKKRKQKAEELLKQQVADFISWLKTEKLIQN